MAEEKKGLAVIAKYRQSPVALPFRENEKVMLVGIGGDVKYNAVSNGALPKQSKTIKEATQAIYKKVKEQGYSLFFEN